MKYIDGNLKEDFPLEHSIAKYFKGEVTFFDKYQGCYIIFPGAKLWIIHEENGFCTIYNERNQKESDFVPDKWPLNPSEYKLIYSVIKSIVN